MHSEQGDETDWKMMGIDVTDPLAAVVNTWADVERYRPGMAAAFYDWFTYYKVARGDAVIPIVGGTYQNASQMVAVVQESHGWWAELVRGEAVDSNEINYNQTSNTSAGKSYVESGKATGTFGIPRKADIKAPAEKPAKYDKWYYLTTKNELVEIL
jgi:inorganic pyrophosphatase